MDPSKQPYEAFFGFVERPFSLTPDPKYYFRSRSHGRAFDALSAGIGRRESLLLITGDLGVGKTTLCRTLMALLERKTRSALVGNSLLSPEDLLRLLLQDLGAVAKDQVRHGRLVGATRAELRQMLDEFLVHLRSNKDGAVLIIDEAHSLPSATVDQVVQLAAPESNREKVLQILLAGQPSVTGGPTLPRTLDERLSTRVKLLPLERDECERYIHHRLTIAGGAGVTFSAPAIDVIYGLSGGVARLVNLLAERALQEGAVLGARRIEPAMIESAASALQLLRLRPRRFRWFGTNTR
ncbi:MAG: ExeA family protein [Vicinamibacterales bacterium]